MIACSANAQKIVHDKMYNDSIRVVFCEKFKAKSYTNSEKCYLNLIGCENVNNYYKNIIFFLEIALSDNLINSKSIITLKSLSYDNIILSHPFVRNNKSYFFISEKDLYRLSNGMYQMIINSNHNIYIILNIIMKK